MAKKKDKTMTWVLLLGGAGALWWYLSRQNTAAAAAAATTTTAMLPAPPTTALPAPVTSVIPPVTTAATITPTPAPITSMAPTTVLSSGSTLQPSGVPYDPRMDTLQNWAVASLNPCDLSRWNTSKGSFTPDEWNGLFDLYFNDWIGGQGNTAARTAFWNTWRIKYSILTATPC
jgi:hypothetical protein